MPPPSGATPRLALPYPIPDDSVDVPRDVKALADRLDALAGAGATGAASARPVLDVGIAGQVRAGRQLAAADFTALGLAAPAGLWNLSDASDVSGNNRPLTNKGGVPFGVGINGLAATAAVFAGSTAQALYIADTGAADPFRLRTGSVGCWVRTAKRGTDQSLVSKWGVANQQAFILRCANTNVAQFVLSTTGADIVTVAGVSEVADDRWHHLVATFDGVTNRLYVDGQLEVQVTSALVFAGSSPFNVGGHGGDAATGTGNPHYGRVDEAFATADVLSEDQVRGLYCAKIAHTLGVVPTRVALAVRRRKRGGPLAVADFPTQPLRLHNFTAGSLADEGSASVALTNNNSALAVAGADGAPAGAYSFAASASLSSTDAGLPAGTAVRSYGAWLKTVTTVAGVIGWGSAATAALLMISGTGQLQCYSAADAITGPVVNDGQWHQVVVVEDNAAGDGARRKLYLDGRLVGTSTVLNSIALAGANAFRIGAKTDGTTTFVGQLDGAFVSGYALTPDQVAVLYAKGSQALAPSPKEEGAHVEAMDVAAVYATFDTLGSQHQVDLGVAT